MAKRTKKVVAEVVEAPAVEVVAAPKKGKLTNGTVLVLGEKPAKLRTDANKAAWDLVCKALPATMAELAKIPEVQACNVGDKAPGFSMVSYLLRRRYLSEQK